MAKNRIALAGLALILLIASGGIAALVLRAPLGMVTASITEYVATDSKAILATLPDDVLTSEGSPLTGQFADRGIDTDGNGLFDAVQIDVGVDTSYEFTYTLRLDLEGASGQHLASGWASDLLSVGVSTMMVEIPSAQLTLAGEDGPYIVSAVSLTADSPSATVHVGTLLDAHVTAAYTLTVMEPSDLRLTGTYTDTAVDHDGDGLYDALVIAAGITVTYGAEYSVMSSLIDGNGDLIVGHSETLYLDAADQLMQLFFSGDAIRASHVDGPYVLATVAVTREGASVALTTDSVHQTLPYAYTEFGTHGCCQVDIHGAEAIAVGAPSGGDVGTARRQLYDYLRVSSLVTVTQSPSSSTEGLNVEVLLQGQDGTTIAMRSEHVAYAGSNANYEILVDFPGGEIRESGVDGPYLIGVVLTDDAGTILDRKNATHDTDAYAAVEFVPWLVRLNSTYAATPVDEDGDGRFDELRFDIGVVPGKAGQLTAQGIAVSGSGADIARLETGFDTGTAVEVNAGTLVTITLILDGGSVFFGQHDGPYSLSGLHIYHKDDPTQYRFAEHAYTTSYYAYTEFE